MNDEDYDLYIKDLCNKLIKQRHINVVLYRDENKKIKVELKRGEQYHELNDDDKYNVERNLKSYFTELNIQEVNITETD